MCVTITLYIYVTYQDIVYGQGCNLRFLDLNIGASGFQYSSRLRRKLLQKIDVATVSRPTVISYVCRHEKLCDSARTFAWNTRGSEERLVRTMANYDFTFYIEIESFGLHLVHIHDGFSLVIDNNANKYSLSLASVKGWHAIENGYCPHKACYYVNIDQHISNITKGKHSQ